jgi:hypothetical protein
MMGVFDEAHHLSRTRAGNKIVHGGVTDDRVRREREHQQKWPKGHIVQVGPKQEWPGNLFLALGSDTGKPRCRLMVRPRNQRAG